MKRPSFQFYPGDWLQDSALRICSPLSRALWIDMLCLMHQGNPYGYLKAGDKVILPVNLAQITGITISEVEGCLSEMQQARVFDKDADGIIFSRRMIRDEEIRNLRAQGGEKGGNPALLIGSKKVNLPANLPPTPSSSSASSSSPSVNTNTPPKGGMSFEAEVFAIYPRREGKKAALKAIAIAIKANGREKIMERTKAYALAVSGWPQDARQFIPHPSTWFNQGRFDDDPATWERKPIQPVGFNRQPPAALTAADHAKGF